MKLSEFVAKLQEYPQDLILEIHCPFDGMQLNLHTSNLEKTANIFLVADALEEDYRWANPEHIRVRMQPKEENTPTLKRMTRQEVINALVNLIMDSRVYREEDIPNFLRYGHRGYQDYTDQELLKAYVDNFEDELENTRVVIVSAECKDGSVQKKG